jgi:hypothetical protein
VKPPMPGAGVPAAPENRGRRRAGLPEVVELVRGDATGAVAALPGPFDCVFFDADRVSAPDQLERLLPRLARDVLLLAEWPTVPDQSSGSTSG